MLFRIISAVLGFTFVSSLSAWSKVSAGGQTTHVLSKWEAFAPMIILLVCVLALLVWVGLWQKRNTRKPGPGDTARFPHCDCPEGNPEKGDLNKH